MFQWLNRLVIHFLWPLLFFLFFLNFRNPLSSQYIINGDFEINSGVVGEDYLDMENQAFNDFLEACFSFGENHHLNGALDLISTSTWGVPAVSGNWYLGISNTKERFSLELSNPLNTGILYTLSYYQAARAQNGKTAIRIGLSETVDNFGDLIFEGDIPIAFDSWEFISFSFLAPNDGQFLTVECKQDVSGWLKVDNFCLAVDSSCFPYSDVIFPNVFSPNFDGVNDFFQAIVIEGVKEGKVSVYNRWGALIHEDDIFSFSWDGTFNGNLCTEGTYFYRIDYIDSSSIHFQKSGTITVFR